MAADKAIIAAGNTVLSEYNAEDGSEAKELNFIFADFNKGESQNALVQAGSVFYNDKTAENAKDLVEKWVVYLEETATDQLWALSDANKAYYVKYTDKTVIEDYNFAVAVVEHKDLYNKYPLRLKAVIDEEDMAKNDKYLMVDTARWEEATENPSNSPELLLSNKKPSTEVADFFFNARYNYRLTYFPTQDSLVIEPLNASVMNDAEFKAEKTWRNSIVASQFISSSDITSGNKGLSASNTDLATAPEEAPVAVMLSKLNTKDGWVVTAGGTDKPKGSAAEGTLHTCIEFDHSYPYLTRTTLDQAVYTIQLVTDKAPDLTTHRANGVNVVADMSGHVVYDEKRLLRTSLTCLQRSGLLNIQVVKKILLLVSKL